MVPGREPTTYLWSINRTEFTLELKVEVVFEDASVALRWILSLECRNILRTLEGKVYGP